jgi:hypothetical protein
MGRRVVVAGASMLVTVDRDALVDPASRILERAGATASPLRFRAAEAVERCLGLARGGPNGLTRRRAAGLWERPDCGDSVGRDSEAQGFGCGAEAALDLLAEPDHGRGERGPCRLWRGQEAYVLERAQLRLQSGFSQSGCKKNHWNNWSLRVIHAGRAILWPPAFPQRFPTLRRGTRLVNRRKKGENALD